MANINQDQQSTSRHSSSSVFKLSLPVCERQRWSCFIPHLSHLVRVNMDQYSAHTHTHTQKCTLSSKIVTITPQCTTVQMLDQVILCCVSPTSRNWALTLKSGGWLPASWARSFLFWIPSNSWWTARGMMPCSSRLRLTSKPVPMVYVFPEPVWDRFHQQRQVTFTPNINKRQQVLHACTEGNAGSLDFNKLSVCIYLQCVVIFYVFFCFFVFKQWISYFLFIYLFLW